MLYKSNERPPHFLPCRTDRAIVADPVGQNMVYLALRCKGDESVAAVSDYYKAKHGMVETLLPQTRPEGQSEFEVRSEQIGAKLRARRSNTSERGGANCKNLRRRAN